MQEQSTDGIRFGNVSDVVIYHRRHHSADLTPHSRLYVVVNIYGYGLVVIYF